MNACLKRALRRACVVLLFCSVDAYTADYYVSPAGSDLNGDGSIGNPWQTLECAIDKLYPDDALYLRAGEYHEQLISVRDGNDGAGGYGIDCMPEGTDDSIYNGTVQNCRAYINAGAFDNCDGFVLGHDGVSDIRFHNARLLVSPGSEFRCDRRGKEIRGCALTA